MVDSCTFSWIVRACHRTQNRSRRHSYKQQEYSLCACWHLWLRHGGGVWPEGAEAAPYCSTFIVRSTQEDVVDTPRLLPLTCTNKKRFSTLNCNKSKTAEKVREVKTAYCTTGCLVLIQRFLRADDSIFGRVPL